MRGVFLLADARRPDDVAVRVFEPELERDGYLAPGTVLETNAVDVPFLVDSVIEAGSASVLPALRMSCVTLNSMGSPWQSQPGM